MAARLTIETTAEQEQAILDGIKQMQQSTPDWQLLGPNCATKSEDLLRLGGIEVSGVTPGDAWNTAYRRYSDDYLNPGKRLQDPEFWQHGNSAMLVDKGLVNPQRGVEYGHDPRGQAAKLDRNAINNDRILTFREGKRVR